MKDRQESQFGLSRFRSRWSALVLLSVSLLGIGAYSAYDLTHDMDTLFQVFRGAVQLNVDKVSSERLMSGAIRGMLSQLDPYAAYIPRKDYGDLRFMRTGGYAGIGAIIQQAGEYAQVASLYAGTPSATSGMRVGDTIVAIDNETMRGVGVNGVSDRLRGLAGTTLVIKLRRPYVEDTVTISLTRANVYVPSVPFSKKLDSHIAYVHLSSFTAQCADEVRRAIEGLNFRQDELKGIILDLRGNTGGLIDEAFRLLGFFLPHSTPILHVRGRDTTKSQTIKTQINPYYENVPIAVLVNRESASASEIVAGALQDLDRAVIVGDRTFGKGLVQTTFPLPYGGTFKVTTAKYYTPSGRCIQALDYSHRDTTGAVGHIPDSLIREFRTAGGRVVLDGGGIYPDVYIRDSGYSVFTSSLYYNNAMFNFATKYVHHHPEPQPLESLSVSQEDLKGFLAYLHEAEFYKKLPLYRYLTIFERDFAPDESLAIMQPHLDAARADLQLKFDSIFWSQSDKLKEVLEQEIASRYYFTAGRSSVAMRGDSVVKDAVKLLQNSERYRFILSKQSPLDPRAEQVASRRKIRDVAR